MIQNNRTFATAVTGIALMAITLFAFFSMAKAVTAMDFLALFFILFAEIGFFGGVLTIEKKGAQQLFRPGVYTILGVYAIASLAISFLFILIQAREIQLLIIMQIVLLTIASFTLLLLINSNRSYLVQGTTAETANAPTLAVVMEAETEQETGTPLAKVFRMRNHPANNGYEAELEKLHAALCYADPPLNQREKCYLNQKLQGLETVLTGNDEDKSIRIALKTNDILMFLQERKETVPLDHK